MIEVHDGIEVGTVLYCEDVRQEAGGKWSILGVFSADIVVTTVPGNIKIALYIEAKTTKAYKGPLSVRFRLDNDEIGTAHGELDSRPGVTVLPVPQIVMGIEHTGTLRIDVGTSPANWVEVARKQILLGTVKDGVVTIATEPLPPS